MSFPEGKDDWGKIMHFVIALLRTIGSIFLGNNPDGEDESNK